MESNSSPGWVQGLNCHNDISGIVTVMHGIIYREQYGASNTEYGPSDTLDVSDGATDLTDCMSFHWLAGTPMPAAHFAIFPMELRQLKQLVVLAETLNFHRAAERLHMTQPPLSASIKKLEEEIGVTLFDRLPSGLKLTSTGEVVLRSARRSLFFAEELKRAAREGDLGEQGMLRIGFVGSATYSLMPQLIRGFRRQYPRVDLVIEESTTSELLRRLEKQTLDVALVRYPVLELSDATITFLQQDQMVLAVSFDSALAGRSTIALAELADEPFIIYSSAMVPTMHTLIMYAFQEAGVKPRIAQEAVQVQTLLSLVESGLGVALVPAVASKYAGSGIRLVPLTDMPAKLIFGIALATLPDATTATARNFIALARTLVRSPTLASDVSVASGASGAGVA